MDLLTLVIPLSMTLAGGTLGCTVTTEPPVVVTPAPTGTLTVHWTVANSVDPSACSAYSATDLEVVLYDESGTQVTSATGPCEGFALTIPLPEGSYSADVTLVDPNGTARSTTKPLQALSIIAGTDLAVDLDFPSTSIL
jgi:hypothetical protein